MKKILIVFFLLWISVLLFGCNDIENSAMDTSLQEKQAKSKDKIKYNIDQIYFSRSFQSITPNVEVIENSDKKRILANLGLSQYSEVSIDNISLNDNEVNIYISGYKGKSISSLSVPQIILDFTDKSIENIENLKFNLIYNDYDYIDIKFNINDVLNKLEANFKLALNSSPHFDLKKIDDNVVWEITYKNIISRDIPDYPLIDLHAEIDANTGEILNSEKEIISSVVDIGNILDFNKNGAFIYEKPVDTEGDVEKQELWFYNTITEEKNMIYNYYYPVLSAKISNNLENIAFIEKTENASETYVFSNSDSKIYKLQFEKEFNPQILQWKSNNLLYLLENNKVSSTIYSYDLNTNDISLISKVNKDIDNLIASKEGFIVAENIEKGFNKKLSFTKDFKKYKTLNKGFNPKFIDEKTIAYLKNNEKTDVDYLLVYDIEEEKLVCKIEEDVLNYSIVSNDNILYVKNNPKYKDFTLSSYSIDKKSSSDIINIIGKNAYYNKDHNLIYLNINLPFEDGNSNIIYSIDLK